MKKKSILLCSVLPGNMDALYKYYNKNDNLINKYDVIFLDCSSFYKNKIVGHIKKLKYFLRSYNLVVADYPTMLLNKGKKSIYMDHGSGLKSMPGKYEIYDKKIIDTSKCIANCSYFIIQSDREKQFLYNNLPYIKNKINYITLGQPRNDKLFNKDYIDKSNDYIKKKYKLEGYKLILLAPTWRGYKIKSDIFDDDNLIKLNNYLRKTNYKLIYRPHYLEDIIGKDKLNKLSNFIYIDSSMESDTQKILTAIDVLISDYSGISIEYLALNRPIIFMDIDTQQYDYYRGLVIDYYNDIHTPGPKVKNVDDIINYINNIEEDNDTYYNKRSEAIKYYYKYYDGNSSTRIWNLIKNIL